MIEEFIFTDELKLAYNALENSKHHLFITGNAGTGKSCLMKYFIANTKKRVALLASTGLSAINIGGQTIHSFFMFPPRLIDKNCIKRSPKKIYRKLDIIAIDESSMIRADILDGIDLFMRANGRDRKLPFGGTRLVLVGDLFQLPPVVSQSEEYIYDQLYKTPYFFSSNIFPQIMMKLIELKKIFRQSDSNFVSLLNKVRRGNTNGKVLPALNERVFHKELERKKGPYIALTSTNKLAGTINNSYLALIKEESKIYEAEILGNFNFSEINLPIDFKLELKPGARVIFTKNDTDKRWVNGTLGVVDSVYGDHVMVEINDEKFTGTARVEKETWDKVSYKYDEYSKSIEHSVVGSVRQIPLRLAWAITIHRSQGTTFDRIYVDTSRSLFAHGQLYVALSRCRSIEGLVLKKALVERDVIVDQRIIEFSEKEIEPFVR